MGFLFLPFPTIGRHAAAMAVVALHALTASGQAPGGGTPALRPPEDILITGVPSTIEYPRSFLYATVRPGPDAVCVPFAVRSADRITPTLRLSTTGLSGAKLARVVGPAGCDDIMRTASGVLSLANVGDQDVPLMLVLPEKAFPSAPAGSKGKLIAYRAGNAPLELAITAQREDFSPAAKAAFWFFGVAIPALVTAAIGLIVYHFQKRMDSRNGEREVLERFRRDESAPLRGFFSGLYLAIRAYPPGKDYRLEMRKELEDRGILFALPAKRRRALIDALNGDNRDAVERELLASFPEFRTNILGGK